jgi:hypothetical protein
MLVKYHGDPENHNLLYDQGKSTCSLWEIDTDGMRKKNGKDWSTPRISVSKF